MEKPNELASDLPQDTSQPIRPQSSSQGGASLPATVPFGWFERSPIAQFFIQRTNRVVYANRAAHDLFGPDIEEALPTSLFCAFHPAETERHLENCNALRLTSYLHRCFQEKNPRMSVELSNCFNNRLLGPTVVWRVHLSYLDGTDPEMVLVSLEDLSAEKRSAWQLERREAALRNIIESTLGLPREQFFESMTRSIARITSADYTLIGELQGNDSVRTLCLVGAEGVLPNIVYPLKGSPCEQVVGKKTCIYTQGVAHLFPNDELLSQMGIESYIGTPIFDQTGQGVGLIVSLFVRPISDTGASETIFEIFSSTIGSELERKRAVQNLEENQALLSQQNVELHHAKLRAEESDQLKTAFLKNLSHEIRTPLNGIVGFVEMMASRDLTDEQLSYYSQVIADSSNKLLRMVNDVLDVARIDSRQVVLVETDFDLGELFEELFGTFEWELTGKDVQMTRRIALEPNECTIHADYEKLKRVVEHLLANAIKFTHRGSIELSVWREGSELMLKVSDTGIGIAAEYQQAVFEYFRQAGADQNALYGGAGLGLSVCKGFVEAMGGRIWLQSKVGQGTSFYVAIPYLRAQPAPSEAVVFIESKNLRVLVAEDEEINYLFLQEILAETEAKIVRAFNGAEAVELVQRFRFDLVLMDLKMPVMDGFEATRRIKALLPGLPIIAQTAYCEASDQQRALGAGCVDFFSKPIHPEALLASIRKHTYFH